METPEHWTLSVDSKYLEREFTFDSYSAGLDKAMAVGKLADELNHHPDMELGYKRLRVTFTTHDSGGLTDRDYAAALKVNAL